MVPIYWGDVLVNTTPRQRTCKCGCGERFTPVRPFQTWATFECQVKIATKKAEQAKEKREKAERKATREAKLAAKPLSWYVSKAQKAFNAYIRERDKHEPCISCSRHDYEITEHPIGGMWDCGHFHSRGAHPELRFEELNAAKQCKTCNGGSNYYAHKSKTVADAYRANLIERIGQEKVDWLDGPHPAKHWTRDDLLTIEAEFKQKLKELKGNHKEAA